MAAVEAMACGAPTVVTEHGGLHRMLAFGRDALFADPFDRHDLAVTLAKLLRYEALQRTLARFGAATVRRLFTWSSVASACAALVAAEPEEAESACVA
jgi:mannosylfructose-phosphate synthase